jgi:hypothetical protein
MYVFTADMNLLQEYITVGIQSNILFVMSTYHAGIRYYIYIFTVNRNSLQDCIKIYCSTMYIFNVGYYSKCIAILE